jgi:hypothetical protein
LRRLICAVQLKVAEMPCLAKNANRAFVMLALVNLVKWGRPLTGEVRPKQRELGEIPPIPGLSFPALRAAWRPVV